MLGQKEENSRQDPHVSMPSAGEGIAAPSCVEGSGGSARQHCNQRAFSAPFFASISAAASAASVDSTASGRFSVSPCLAPPDDSSCWYHAGIRAIHAVSRRIAAGGRRGPILSRIARNLLPASRVSGKFA